MFNFILQNFVLFFRILTEVAVEMFATAFIKIWEKKWWKMSVGMTRFSNDETARPPTLLKLESQNFQPTKSTNFGTAVLKNTCERLLQFYKKHVL